MLEKTTLYIKNMVCPRCVKAVRNALEELGLHPEQVVMGEAIVATPADQIDYPRVRQALEKHGFELLEEKKAWIIEKIKTLIVDRVHHQTDTSGNLSQLIEDKLGLEYTYLSSLFSSSEGMTIEKYTIRQRIERVKELLIYDELTLSEIAWKMGYSSVAHLSNQFKKVTGLTPTAFKHTKERQRKPLDEI